ncbi:MAG: hypothetical protein AB1640_00230 [bacterium]
MNELTWSKGEKAAARWAFDKAYRNECAAFMKEVKAMARELREPEDLWKLQDSLGGRLKEISEKYDYRYSVLIFVFARLLREGWLAEGDLDGLGKDKIERIRNILGAIV